MYAASERRSAAARSDFKATLVQERRVSDAGYSFARRKTDGPEIIPVAAFQHPRRKHEAAQ
jgi:hypothetical protein